MTWEMEMKENFEDGYKQGIDDGYQSGLNKDAAEKAIAAMKSFNLPKEKVVEGLNLTPEQIELLDATLKKQDQ